MNMMQEITQNNSKNLDSAKIESQPLFKATNSNSNSSVPNDFLCKKRLPSTDINDEKPTPNDDYISKKWNFQQFVNGNEKKHINNESEKIEKAKAEVDVKSITKLTDIINTKTSHLTPIEYSKNEKMPYYNYSEYQIKEVVNQENTSLKHLVQNSSQKMNEIRNLTHQTNYNNLKNGSIFKQEESYCDYQSFKSKNQIEAQEVKCYNQIDESNHLINSHKDKFDEKLFYSSISGHYTIPMSYQNSQSLKMEVERNLNKNINTGVAKIDSNDYNKYLLYGKMTMEENTRSKIFANADRKILNLPIMRYKDEIIEKIIKNQVTIIAGKTGCGKTTQVPKFIATTFPNSRIIMTQPRRIAVFSIHNRIREEVKNNLKVGYHVGMNPNFRDETDLLIVTTGIFLQRLIHERQLNEFTHVILDEVHERDLDIDFVMILMKHVLYNNPNTKLILMSATIATTLFSNYFSRSNISNVLVRDYFKDKETEIKQIQNPHFDEWQYEEDCEKEKKYAIEQMENTWKYEAEQKISNERHDLTTSSLHKKENYDLLDDDAAEIVSVMDKIYNIKYYYLDEIVKNCTGVKRQEETYSSHFLDIKNPRIDPIVYEYASEIVRHILKGNFRADDAPKYASVLIFLPGFAEIQNMNEVLNINLENYIQERKIGIYQLHSNLTEYIKF